MKNKYSGKKSGQSGFTMVELMISLTIILLVTSAILTVSYRLMSDSFNENVAIDITRIVNRNQAAFVSQDMSVQDLVPLSALNKMIAAPNGRDYTFVSNGRTSNVSTAPASTPFSSSVDITGLSTEQCVAIIKKIAGPGTAVWFNGANVRYLDGQNAIVISALTNACDASDPIDLRIERITPVSDASVNVSENMATDTQLWFNPATGTYQPITRDMVGNTSNLVGIRGNYAAALNTISLLSKI